MSKSDTDAAAKDLCDTLCGVQRHSDDFSHRISKFRYSTSLYTVVMIIMSISFGISLCSFSHAIHDGRVVDAYMWIIPIALNVITVAVFYVRLTLWFNLLYVHLDAYYKLTQGYTIMLIDFIKMVTGGEHGDEQ